MRVKEAAYEGEISTIDKLAGGPPPPLPVVEFFGDESFVNGGERFLVIGGIAVLSNDLPQVEERLRAVRAKYPAHLAVNEVKWSKCSRGALQFYKDYVDVFFGAADRNLASFTSLRVDKHTFNHRLYNANDPDVGFNKLVYQLLLHKMGKAWGGDHRIMVRLDHRVSKHKPDELRPMLNADLRRRWDIATYPFKRIEYRDSKKTEMLQLNDLLIGALGSTLNPRPERAGHKIELAAHIMNQANETCSPAPIWSLKSTTFQLWNFAYKGGR